MRKVSGIDVELFEDFRAEKFSGIAHLADSITGIIGSRCRNLEDFSRVQEAPVLRTCDLDPEYFAYFNQVRLTGSLNLKTRAGAVRKISVFAVEMRWREEDREVLHKQLSFASGILASPPGGAGCDTADRSCGIFLFLAPDCRSFRVSLVLECCDGENKVFERNSFAVREYSGSGLFCDRMIRGKRWEFFEDLQDSFSAEKVCRSFLKDYTGRIYRNFISSVEQNDPDIFLRERIRKLMIRLLCMQLLQADEKLCSASQLYDGTALFCSDENIKLPESCFTELYDTFKRYVFTAEENTPFDCVIAIGPDMPGRVWEILLDDNRSHGVFYTPEKIVSYMCREALAAHLGDTADVRNLMQDHNCADIVDREAILEKLRSVKICDPASGAGVFPVCMLDLLCRIRLKLELREASSANIAMLRKEIIRNNIYGVDIDPFAVEIARFRLWLAVVSAEGGLFLLSDFDCNILQGNSLLEQPDGSCSGGKRNFFPWRTVWQEVFEKNGGFDIFIGNPPYVGEKYHRELFEPVKNSAAMGRYYQGKMDYFYFFFHLALDMLKENAAGVFITTNYFAAATGAVKLRADLKKRAALLALCNFGELKLFDNASGQHNMITLFRKTAETEVACRVTDIHLDGVFSGGIIVGIENQNLPQTVFRNVSNTELFEGENNYIRISFASADGGTGESVFRKMTSNSRKLGEIASVRTGIMGGCDNVNRKNIRYAGNAHDLQTGDGVFVLDRQNARDRMRLEKLKKHRFLKAFYKNSDIGKYTVSDVPEKYLIFSSPDEPEEEQQIIKRHLAGYRSILEHIRKINREKTEHWYLLRRGTGCREVYESPKITAPQRSRSNVFGYHEGEWYASADVYYITHAAEGYPLKFILGLLNSRLYYYWLYHKGKRKGDMLELYQQPLSAVPVAAVPEEKQRPVIELVEKILELKMHDRNADTSCQERQLDALVYAIFGLTEKEIAAVENCCCPADDAPGVKSL